MRPFRAYVQLSTPVGRESMGCPVFHAWQAGRPAIDQHPSLPVQSALLCMPMNDQDEAIKPLEGKPIQSLLSQAFKERITTLGLSRRDVSIRSGLSRQTLHNIEHEGQTKFIPQTLRALESALMWEPGTCMQLLNGIDNTGNAEFARGVRMAKETILRWGIVERVSHLSLEELERFASALELEVLGINEDTHGSAEVQAFMRKSVESMNRRISDNVSGGQTRSDSESNK
jgi:transcriptional regulator with XRE-family HTH domain